MLDKFKQFVEAECVQTLGPEDYTHDKKIGPIPLKNIPEGAPSRRYMIDFSKPCNVTVLDIDLKHGEHVREDIEASLGISVDEMINDCGLYVRTPSGGYHLYFQAEKKIKSKNEIAPHLDIRSPGDKKFYLTVPPSQKNGKPYDILICRELSKMPKNLLKALTDAQSKKPANKNNHAGGSQTGRNVFLTSQAGKLLSAEELTPKKLFEELQQINLKEFASNPLPIEEVETIAKSMYSKDQQNAVPFHMDGKFKPALAAEYLIEKMNLIQIQGVIYSYDSGKYSEVANEALSGEVYNVVGANLYKQGMNEIHKTVAAVLGGRSEAEEQPENIGLIPFTNGVLDIFSGELLPHSPDYRFLFQYGVPYNPEIKEYASKESLVGRALKAFCRCDPKIKDSAPLYADEEKKLALLVEIMGSLFMHWRNGMKLFLMLGTGANGKSAFIRMLELLLGDGNYSCIDLSELPKQFGREDLIGKLAMLNTDIESKALKETATLKKLLSEESQSIQRKNLRNWTGRLATKIVLGANKMPRICDSTHGMARRLVIFPFRNIFSPEYGNEDKTLLEKIRNDPRELESLSFFAVQGLNAICTPADSEKRLIIYNDYIVPEDVREAVASTIENERWQQDFVDECLIPGTPEQFVHIKDVVQAFYVWRRENDIHYGKSSMWHALREIGIEQKVLRIGDRTQRVIMGYSAIVPSMRPGQYESDVTGYSRYKNY